MNRWSDLGAKSSQTMGGLLLGSGRVPESSRCVYVHKHIFLWTRLSRSARGEQDEPVVAVCSCERSVCLSAIYGASCVYISTCDVCTSSVCLQRLHQVALLLAAPGHMGVQQPHLLGCKISQNLFSSNSQHLTKPIPLLRVFHRIFQCLIYSDMTTTFTSIMKSCLNFS